MISLNSFIHKLANTHFKLFRSRYFYFGLFLGLAVFLSFLPSRDISSRRDSMFNFKHPLQATAKTNNYPILSTNYYILLDVATNQILLSSHSHDRVYPASTTKLATALTALNIYPLDEVVAAKSYSDGKVMELKDEEKVTVQTLVSALLIYSANDAAYNLAIHSPGSSQAFVSQMNALAAKYGLKDTHFVNYDGLHDPDHYSTPYDLAQLGRLASQNPIVREIVKTKSTDLTDVNHQYIHRVTSTNELLGLVPEIEGLKTGWTPEASGCFIGLINIQGHYLISVVAQSEDRFADTKLLVNWAKNNLTWRTYQ